MTPEDRELDDYLAGRSRVSARYRAASVETTTPELDRAVLDHARAAARQRPAAQTSWQQRWAVPVGIAATLVIGVDLAWRVSDRARSERAASEPAAPVLSEDLGTAERSRRIAAAPSPAVPEPETAAALQAPEADPRVAASADAVLRQEAAEIQAEDDAQTTEAMKAQVAPDAADPAARDTALADAAATGSFAPPAEPAIAAAGLTEEADAEVIQAERALRAAKARAAERRAAVPQAALLAAPEPEPAVPRRSAAEARAAAEEVTALLRARDFDSLRLRYTAAALARQALEGAATVLEAGLRLRLIEDTDGAWRADYLDADDQLRCALRLRPSADGWALVGLATLP